ncbi:LysM peptidoglycan-binding domain-containing protein [Georgenia sp.]
MSALVAHPAWEPARPVRLPTRPHRRAGLELVGPGFVPRRPVAVEAPAAVSHEAAGVVVVPGERSTATPLRLTRRGRGVRTAVVLVVATALSVGLGVAAGLRVPAGVAPGTAAVTVEAGDTLWVLAAGAAGVGEDVRDVVAEIAELNALSSHELRAGQQLLVPVH